METHKLAAWAAGGIALLGAVALAAIWMAPGDRSPSREAGAPDSGVPAPSPVLPAPALPGPSGPAQPVPQGTVILGAPPDVPPPGSWEAVPPAARVAAMGEVGPYLGRELNELQPRLSACFDEDSQARHGTTPITATQDQAPMDDHGTTVLMLEVETQAGRARIVDAPVETLGRASDGLVACAQRILRGHTFPVPGVTPGKRYRGLHTLLP
jgi:hypothetical protein